MSKQEEIKQALAAATPGPWVTYKWSNDERYAVYQSPVSQKTAITGWGSVTQSKENAELIAKAPEYIDWLLKQEQSLQEDIMVLKDMVHTRNVENERLRKEIIVKDNSNEVLTKQITDEVAISATAMADIVRLHDENQSLRRSLTSEAVKDAKYNAELMRLGKEFEEIKQATLDLRHHAESLYQIIQRGDLSTLDLTQADGEYDSFCKIIKALGQEGEGNQ